MAKILIAGCGAIGHELGTSLTLAGHDVTGLKRNIPEPNRSPFRIFRADITKTEDLRLLDDDFEYSFFILSPGGRDIADYRAVYETGLNNVLEKFSSSRCKWLFVSSTSVYGQHQGEWVDENSPTEPNNDASLTIVNAEQLIRSCDTDNIIVRFSGIYGPGREYLLKTAKQTPDIQKQPPYYTNRIHQTDCVRILAFLLNCRINNIPLEQCYLASDDAPAPIWDVISWLAEAMKCPAPREKTVLDTVDMNKRCRNDKIKQLGYRFAYSDFKAGYGEMIRSKIE